MALLVTLVAQVALQATRAPVEATRERLVPRPVKLLRPHRHSRPQYRAETPFQALGNRPHRSRAGSGAGRLSPQPEGQDANRSSSILFEEWPGGQGDGPRGGSGPGKRASVWGYGVKAGDASSSWGHGLVVARRDGGGRWPEGAGRRGADVRGLSRVRVAGVKQAKSLSDVP